MRNEQFSFDTPSWRGKVFEASKIKLHRSCLANWLGMNFTLGRHIFLSDTSYDYFYMAHEPDDVLCHEYTHYLQQQRVGVVKFLLLYFLCLPFFWNPWRLKWELEAYEVTLRWLAMKGFDYRKAAGQLAQTISSWKYGWMMRRSAAYHWAEEVCMKIWVETKKLSSL